MKQRLAPKVFVADRTTGKVQRTVEDSAAAEARLAALLGLMPYEAPQVVSLPLDGGRRIFPVYMGNM